MDFRSSFEVNGKGRRGMRTGATKPTCWDLRVPPGEI